MNYKLTLTFILLAIVVAIMSTSASAVSMSASLFAPTVDGKDVANYGTSISLDKWFTGFATQGQSFTTGNSPVWVNSITYQVGDQHKAAPSKNYTVRVGTVYGTLFTEIHSETVTQTFTWNASEYMTWAFDEPVLLAPFTEYGIDVGMTSSTTAWQTGIPYISNTDNNFSGGTRYLSGTDGGIGDTTMHNMIGDRVFHIDMDEATEEMAGYASPQSGGTVDAGDVELTWTNLPANTGDNVWVDVWFGTDPIADFSMVSTGGLNTIDKTVTASEDGRYYWRVDSYLNGSATGTPVQGQQFTFFVNETAEPNLISALLALKDYVLSNPVSNDPDIATYRAAINANKPLFGKSIDVMTAAFDLVETYDTTDGFGPLWISQSLPGQASQVDDIHCTVYAVMQAIMDQTYNNQNVVLYESLLDGKIFGCSKIFPGSVDPPASITTHTATINASYPDTAGWTRQGDTLAARKPTGTYLAPGTIATVTVPPALVNSSYMIRVGAHSWDMSRRDPIRRLERSTIIYQIDSTEIKISSPLGGGIYIEVPYKADGGVVNVEITGAVRSPYFSAKSFHTTTLEEWINTERKHPAPWADFQSEKYMCQVPTNWIYNMADPVTMMENWDKGIDVYNDLMGFPRDRGKETIYEQLDVINRSSVLAPGYPTVNQHSTNPTGDGYNGDRTHYMVRGLQIAPSFVMHEHGHAYTIPGIERESTNNLPHVAVWNVAYGYDLDYSFAASFDHHGNPHRTLNNCGVAWMCSFNFSPKDNEMASGEKTYQLKGHAKYVDIAKLFGWQVLNDYWKTFVDEYEATGIKVGPSDDEKMLRLSRAAGVDIRPIFHFWGVHPNNPTALAAAINAEGLFASVDIYHMLMEYKSIVPANNAEFRTFATNWWGRKPSIGGLWTEREHARQWDTEELFSNEARRPNGEIYVEASAIDIQERVQEITDIYFPDGIPDYTVKLSDMVSWSGQPTQLAPVVDAADSALNYAWTVNPADGVVFTPNDGDDTVSSVEAPVVTITKPAGEMASYTLVLTVSDGVDLPVRDTMAIRVYDDSCKAARLGMSLADNNQTDLTGDCITDLEDFAAMALKWLNNSGLLSPLRK